MTGRIHYTPEAEQQLHDLDDWITKAASPDTARSFVRAVMDHVDGILAFPLAGRARDDVRPGMRATAFRKRTLVAYEVNDSADEVNDSADEVVVNVLGVFHGGQDWETALQPDPVDPRES